MNLSGFSKHQKSLLLVGFILLAGTMVAVNKRQSALHLQSIDRANAIHTMQQMHRIERCFLSYATDHCGFPAVHTLSDVSRACSLYAPHLALADAWGTAFHISSSSTRSGQECFDSFLIVSTGSDRTFTEASWQTVGVNGSLTEDCVMRYQIGARAGGFQRWWPVREKHSPELVPSDSRPRSGA